VPSSAVNTVKELFVPQVRIEAVKTEADALPGLDLTKVRTQALSIMTLVITYYREL